MLLAVQDPPGKHIQSLKPTQSSYELRVNYFFCWNCSRITGESVNHRCEFMVSYCMTGEFVVGQCRCIDIGCCRILRMSASLWTTCSLCHLVSVRMCKHLPCTDALTLWTRPCPLGKLLLVSTSNPFFQPFFSYLQPKSQPDSIGFLRFS